MNIFQIASKNDNGKDHNVTLFDARPTEPGGASHLRRGAGLDRNMIAPMCRYDLQLP